MVKVSELLDIDGIISHENLDKDIFVNGGKTDSRQILEGDIYFAFRGANADGHSFIGRCFEKKMAFAVVEKDYDNNKAYPVVRTDNVEKMLGLMASRWRDLHSAKIIGITGTNGKTTTKEMLAHIIFRKFSIISTFKNYNNQIGVPLTLLSIKDDTEIAIVELGTNHPGEIEYLTKLSRPDIGLITNIGDGHLEFLGDRRGVYNEKSKMFEYISENNGKIFKNTEDPYIKEWNRGNITCYGPEAENDMRFHNIEIGKDGRPEFEFRGSKIKMSVPGTLNLKNALAAAVIADHLGVDQDTIALGLSSFIPGDKRYEQLKFNNSDVLLDCYNANPSSVHSFLDDVEMIGKDHIVILGDMLELGRGSLKAHIELIEKAVSKDFREIFLFGDEMEKAVKKVKRTSKVKYFDEFKDLKNEFDRITREGSRTAVKGSRGLKLERLTDE